jgi:radical SAM superfamily enzyme YgiQ (UPF0313 family)
MGWKRVLQMEYEGLICRPSTERASFSLPVSVGCSYNRCKFCIFFKHLKYRLLSIEQIEKELQRVRRMGGNPEKVFLGDGNAFGMETPRLLHIVAMIRRCFPACRMVNMDASVIDIREKTDEELHKLRAAGIRNLYLGIESGLDDVLAFMRKDHDNSQAYGQIRRIRNAGLSFNAHIMTGVSGKRRGLENATALAAFLNRTKPERIVNFSLFLHRTAPLYSDILSGAFTPATEVENLQEAHRLLELLETEALFFDGYHDHLGLRVWGHLPHERPKMLSRLDKAIAALSRQEPKLAYAG